MLVCQVLISWYSQRKNSWSTYLWPKVDEYCLGNILMWMMTNLKIFKYCIWANDSRCQDFLAFRQSGVRISILLGHIHNVRLFLRQWEPNLKQIGIWRKMGEDVGCSCWVKDAVGLSHMRKSSVEVNLASKLPCV
jgi:hypothetical protein